MGANPERRGRPPRDSPDNHRAGDSFGGGMMGYLASVNRSDAAALKKALAYGTCVASITIEGFSLDAVAATNRATVEARLAKYKAMLSLE